METALLSVPESDSTTAEKGGRGFKGQLLIEGASVLVPISARLPDHLQDRGFRRRDRGRALPDIHPFRADPLAPEVVWPRCTSLYGDGDNGLSFDLLRSDLREHGHVRTDGIADGIGDPEHGPVRIVHTADRAVVLHADIQRPAVRVGEGHDGEADILHEFSLELDIASFDHGDFLPTMLDYADSL